MLRQIEFDKNANAFSERYISFLDKIKSLYQSKLFNRGITYKSIRSFEKEANAIAALYLTNEIDNVKEAERLIEQYINSDFALVSMPVKVFSNTEYMNYLDDFTKYLYNSIKHQVTKDIFSVTQKLRVEVLKVSSMKQDYFQIIENYKDPIFSYNDSSGRALPSKKYIRTLVRDYFVKSYNDLYAENVSINGGDKVLVDHVDHTHKFYNLVLTINDAENSLNYFNLRDEIFHPNSNAIVKVVSENVYSK